MSESPRVTIGIPTYNRASMLARAVDSALAQHADLEVVICDNASTDGTQAICEHYAAADQRVRYVRHSSNLGAEANFASALNLARGHYFMWLGDDDWLDEGYVKACTDLLDESAEHSLVSGMARYFEPGASAQDHEDRLMVLEQDNPEERVLSYFALVRNNGVFYGVSRRDDRLRFGICTAFGSDWTHVASFALLGKVRTLQTVSVNRTLGGSSTAAGLQALYGVKGYLARPENHAALLAWRMYVDVSRRADAFKALGTFRRQRLGLAVADTLLTARYGTKTMLLRSRIGPRRRVRAFVEHLKNTLAW